MSEYEETDSLTLAVAKAICFHRQGRHRDCVGGCSPDTGCLEYAMDVELDLAREAIKAYELHQALTRADLP
jgi:hypothetical protein